jgi:hypothetical protein
MDLGPSIFGGTDSMGQSWDAAVLWEREELHALEYMGGLAADEDG